jgi:hypothetical protein
MFYIVNVVFSSNILIVNLSFWIKIRRRCQDEEIFDLLGSKDFLKNFISRQFFTKESSVYKFVT